MERDHERRRTMQITLPTLIDLFVTTKKTEDRSARTQECYHDQLMRYSAFLGGGTLAWTIHQT